MQFKEQIRAINEKYGGSLRNDAEIETALLLGKGKSVFRKIACLWRAILVGHPFTDGNKRTALGAALIYWNCKLDKNEKYMNMLEYYDRTGRFPLKKVRRSFTLKEMNITKLKQLSRKKGKSMSDILDELIEET